MAGQAAYDLLLQNLPGMKKADEPTAMDEATNAKKSNVRAKVLPKAEELLEMEQMSQGGPMPHELPKEEPWKQLLQVAAKPLQKHPLALKDETGENPVKRLALEDAEPVAQPEHEEVNALLRARTRRLDSCAEQDEPSVTQPPDPDQAQVDQPDQPQNEPGQVPGADQPA
eukprot:s3310_g11.t1